MDIKNFSPEITKAVQKKITQNENAQPFQDPNHLPFGSIDLDNLKHESVSIFSQDTQTEEQKNQAYLNYAESLLSELYDSDKDGTVTIDEFKEIERQEALVKGRILDIYQFRVDNTTADRLAQQFATNLDTDESGAIDKEELAFFMKTADGMDGESDGRIVNLAEYVLTNSYLDINFSGEEINNTISKFGVEELSQQEKIAIANYSYYQNMDKAIFNAAPELELQKAFDDNNASIRKVINELNDFR